MKRRLFGFLLAALGATVFLHPVSLRGQTTALPIHDHPQKTSYASPAEWLPFSSQCHWMNPALGDMAATGDMAAMMEHIHIEPTLPAYAEVGGGSLSFPVALKLFHVKGQLGWSTGLTGDYGQSPSAFSVVWDQTGTSSVPSLRGDPSGLITYTGTATVDLAQFLPAHGWGDITLRSRVYFDNGDILNIASQVVMYSVRDVTQPETHLGGATGINVTTSCDVESLNATYTLGSGFSNFLSYIPIAPIQAAWPVTHFGYQYAASYPSELAQGHTEIRLDPDIHHGIPGTILGVFPAPSGNDQGVMTDALIDPAKIPSGAHHLMHFWDQPVKADAAHYPPGSEMWTITLIPITVGATTPGPCETNPLVSTSATFPTLPGPLLTWALGFNKPIATIGAVTGTTATVQDGDGCSLTVTK